MEHSQENETLFCLSFLTKISESGDLDKYSSDELFMNHFGSALSQQRIIQASEVLSDIDRNIFMNDFHEIEVFIKSNFQR